MPRDKVSTRTIILTLTTDSYIILRGALNKFHIDRYRQTERLGRKSKDRLELSMEVSMAKELFEEVDRQWLAQEPTNPPINIS